LPVSRNKAKPCRLELPKHEALVSATFSSFAQFFKANQFHLNPLRKKVSTPTVSDMVPNPRSASKRKSTVCGINGPPSLSLAGSARHLPFISSTAYRALAPPAFFRGPLRFASLTPEKICHSIFSGPQSSFKILEKVASERWQACRFVNAWRGMVHQPYPVWNTYACWLGETRRWIRSWGTSDR